MKNGRMQAKDIPDRPLLEWLAVGTKEYSGYTWYDQIPRRGSPTVLDGMPTGTPGKLALAKMNQLLRRGLVSGCCCGCRGDFEITDQGRAFICASKSGNTVPDL
jgi:hypothetical protein